MSGLSIQNLSMRFDLPNGGHVQALQDVSLDLKAGELMSVLGPSGCGKTTLLNIVAGFLAPTSGVLELNGHRVEGPDAERGMVFQQGALFEWTISAITCSTLLACRTSRKRLYMSFRAGCSSGWLWPAALPMTLTSF